jgi:hypothetical protein
MGNSPSSNSEKSDKKDFDNCLMRNYNSIKEISIINENKYIVSTYKSVSKNLLLYFHTLKKYWDAVDAK